MNPTSPMYANPYTISAPASSTSLQLVNHRQHPSKAAVIYMDPLVTKGISSSGILHSLLLNWLANIRWRAEDP